MKDPLQNSLSSYEILEVSEDSASIEITKAFKKALIGPHKNKATAARKVLLDKSLRAQEDFLLYTSTFVENIKLSDSIENDLKTNRRGLAEKWRLNQLNIFPGIGLITHSTMVLHYWDAIKLTDTILSSESRGESLLHVKNVWLKFIAYFVSCTQNSGFIREWLQGKAYVQENDIVSLSSALPQKLKQDLEKKLYYYQEQSKNNKELNDLINSISEDFKFEISTANKIKSLRLTLTSKDKGKRNLGATGKMFLKEFGFLAEVRKYISDRENSRNNELLVMLSPYSHIQTYINRRQYKEALKQIDLLPPTELSTKEVKVLRTGCLRDFARAEISEANLSGLISFKNKYLNGSSPMVQSVVKEIANEIFNLVSNSRNQNRDQVIEVLTWVNKNVPTHGNIKLKLANLLLQRGIDKYLEGERAYKLNPSDVHKKKMEVGFQDVKKAKELNPNDSRTNEQYEIIKSNLELYDPKTQEASTKNKEGVALLGKADLDIRNSNFIQAKSKISQAKTLFGDALIIQPNNSVYRDNLNIAERMLKDLAKVEVTEKNRKGVKLLEEAQTDIQNGFTDSARQKIEKAKLLFDEVIKADTGNQTFKDNKGVATELLNHLDGMGDRMKAGEINQKGVQILNACQEDYGKYMRGKSILKEFKKLEWNKNMQLSDEGTRLMSEAMETMNKVQYLRDRVSRAFDNFDDALSLVPDNETFYKNRELAYEMLGQLQTMDEILSDKPASQPYKQFHTSKRPSPKPGYYKPTMPTKQPVKKSPQRTTSNIPRKKPPVATRTAKRPAYKSPSNTRKKTIPKKTYNYKSKKRNSTDGLKILFTILFSIFCLIAPFAYPNIPTLTVDPLAENAYKGLYLMFQWLAALYLISNVSRWFYILYLWVPLSMYLYSGLVVKGFNTEYPYLTLAGILIAFFYLLYGVKNIKKK